MPERAAQKTLAATEENMPVFSYKHTEDIKVALLTRLALVLAQSNRYISAKASLRSLTGFWTIRCRDSKGWSGLAGSVSDLHRSDCQGDLYDRIVPHH